MEPNTPTPDNKKAFVLLGALLFITIAGAIIPAAWFNVDTTKDTLDLTSIDTIDVTPKDKETDQPLSWKQLAENALSDQPELLAAFESAPLDADTVAQLNDEENLTASFSKNLYVASAYLKDNGITDEDAKQDVVNQLIEQEMAKIVRTVYSYKNLSVAKTESKESIKAYGNTVATLLNETLTVASFQNDVKALQEFAQTKSSESVLPIKKDYARVAAMLEKLLKVSTPPSATVYHLAAVNQIAAYKDTLYNLSKIETDPLRANIALQTYTDTVFSTANVYQNLSEYFTIKNIVFSGKESGYVFTVGYTTK